MHAQHNLHVAESNANVTSRHLPCHVQHVVSMRCLMRPAGMGHLMSMHLRHMVSASSRWLASFSSKARLLRLVAVRGSSDPKDRSLITRLRRASASASSKLQRNT